MTHPIIVPESAAGNQLRSGFRDCLKIAGTALLTNAVFIGSFVQGALGVILIIGPILWSQYSVRIKHALFVKVAEAAPNDVAEVVRK